MAMLRSESVVKITEALLKAQIDIKHAIKDATNPHFKSKYATLESVIDSTKDALNKNGVNVMQTTTRDGFLITTLQHSSGEFISSEITLMLDKQNMQSL